MLSKSPKLKTKLGANLQGIAIVSPMRHLHPSTMPKLVSTYVHCLNRKKSSSRPACTLVCEESLGLFPPISSRLLYSIHFPSSRCTRDELKIAFSHRILRCPGRPREHHALRNFNLIFHYFGTLANMLLGHGINVLLLPPSYFQSFPASLSMDSKRAKI